MLHDVVDACARRTVRAAGYDRGRAGHRQEPAGGRACARTRRRGRLAAERVCAVRRRERVRVDDGDRPWARGAASRATTPDAVEDALGRTRRARRVRRVRAGVAARRGSSVARRREWRREDRRCPSWRSPRRPRGCWRLRRPTVRSSSRSRTSTGPSRRCATCFRRSSTTPTRRWWCCARRGPSCSTSIPCVGRRSREQHDDPLGAAQRRGDLGAGRGVLATTIRTETERARVLRNIGGNPLFAIEYVRMLTDKLRVGRRGRHADLGPGGDRRSAGFGRAADPRGAAGRRRRGGSLLAGRARGGGRRRRRTRSARRACPSRLDRALDHLVVLRAGGVRVQPRARCARWRTRGCRGWRAHRSTPRWASGSRPRRATARRSSQTRWRTTSSRRCCWPTPRASGRQADAWRSRAASWLVDRG